MSKIRGVKGKGEEVEDKQVTWYWMFKLVRIFLVWLVFRCRKTLSEDARRGWLAAGRRDSM